MRRLKGKQKSDVAERSLCPEAGGRGEIQCGSFAARRSVRYRLTSVSVTTQSPFSVFDPRTMPCRTSLPTVT